MFVEKEIGMSIRLYFLNFSPYFIVSLQKETPGSNVLVIYTSIDSKI